MNTLYYSPGACSIGIHVLLEEIDYCVATLHGQGFARIIRPGNFAPSEADHEFVKARGLDVFTKGLEVLDRALAGREYLTGRFSIADAALFYIEFWAADRLHLPLPANAAAHLARLKARKAVATVLQKEGFA